MPHAPESAGKGRGVKLIYAAFSGLDTLLPFVAVSFWWFDSLDYLVLWLLAYTLLDAGYALPQIFPRLWPTR